MKSKKMWWLNEESQQVLNRGYLLKGETAQDAIERITHASANKLGMPELQPKFEEIIARGWMSLSSPIWSNLGTSRGLPISCFNVHVPDDMQGITTKLGEVIMQTKIGGGTSGYFGDLRGRGASITDNGSSSGSVSFMELFNTTMNVVAQGSVRRGAFAAYLDIDHPDIMEFLRIRDIGHPIQNLYFGVCVPDYWMQEMIDGDADKRQVWAKVLESRQEKGMPYIFFTDNVNKNKPEIYTELGLKINASNLCVAPNTQILTKEGYKIIEELENEQVEVWNGQEFSEVKVVKTGENQTLFKVTVDCITYDINGHIIGIETKTLDCTEYHKWYNYMGQELRTNVLRPNDSLLHSDLPNTTDRVKYVVRSIQKLDSLHDTYCFTEPKRNMGMFNGILTGNCSEINLPSSEKESFVCCLSSMNLELYDEWKDTEAVKLGIYFLDGVMQEFIDKTKGKFGLKQAHNFAYRHRALGLGVLGWHSYLQRNIIPFGSLEANFKTTEIFKFIKEQSDKATLELAEKLGSAPIYNEAPNIQPRRNTTCLAIAPTTSSSAILGQVSAGIEPFASNYYKAGLAKGNFMRKNKYLDALLTKKGINNEDTWRKIMLDGGSVQGLIELNDAEKSVFMTFKEISQHDIIVQASIRQKFIDQTQSLNLNIPPDVPIKDVNALIIEAWKLGVKTLYYQRSQSVAKTMATNLVSCSSCES